MPSSGTISFIERAVFGEKRQLYKRLFDKQRMRGKKADENAGRGKKKRPPLTEKKRKREKPM